MGIWMRWKVSWTKHAGQSARVHSVKLIQAALHAISSALEAGGLPGLGPKVHHYIFLNWATRLCLCGIKFTSPCS